MGHLIKERHEASKSAVKNHDAGAQIPHDAPQTRAAEDASGREPNSSPPRKRQRRTPPERPDPLEQTALPNPVEEEAPGSNDCEYTDPIDFWRTKGRWPREYFMEDPAMYAYATKRSSRSFSRKRSEPGSAILSDRTPSDQRSREEKSAPYRDPKYRFILKTKGTFMAKSERGIARESQELCQKLLDEEQPLPEGSLFDEDVFDQICEELEGRNEAKVIQDISRLIVPPVRHLAIRGAKHLKHATESVNEGWNNSVPLTGSRPQPDYAVGFAREAFTEDQLKKLAPYIGDWIAGDLSRFMATYYMYFPFLTCEVKCGASALNVADRQNAHSATLAARGVVDLFRVVKREMELQRQILSFSISHDDRAVRIYGYYPEIDAEGTKYYRHPIHDFGIQAANGKEKWTAYRFTKNVYDHWMPAHFGRICSAIDQLPSPSQLELDGSMPPPEVGEAVVPSEWQSSSSLDQAGPTAAAKRPRPNTRE